MSSQQALKKIALCVAIILGTGAAAAAAAPYHRISHVAPTYYNMVPDSLGGNGCSPVHPPLCSNICPTDGSPCHINGDY